MAQWRSDQRILYRSHNRTLYEVMMLSDSLTPSGAVVDAFGKQRMSLGYTLFDSTHRYQDNGKWATLTAGSGNTAYQVNESAVNLNVNTDSGDKVYRETKRVFSYQPGKSLLIMNTFVMNTPKTNLRQRVGYFNTDNGIFLENDGTTNYLVLRSNVTGSVVETRVAQTDWAIDKFNGDINASYSAQLDHNFTQGLDVTKGNIFWADIEWLGVGDVRCGFVVEGKPLVAHIFRNANAKTTTYMTTSTLPCRYEIENTGTVASQSTLKQICSTVISEGGYELTGRSNSVSIPISSPKDLPTSGTFTPILSIRLKDSFKDAVAVLRDVEFFGLTNNASYRYKIIVGGTLANASWQSIGTDSCIEYDTAATTITGGREAFVGYIHVSAGSGAQSLNLSRGDLFAYQLERDPFAASNNGIIITLAGTGASNGNDAVGSMVWEEI